MVSFPFYEPPQGLFPFRDEPFGSEAHRDKKTERHRFRFATPSFATAFPRSSGVLTVPARHFIRFSVSTTIAHRRWTEAMCIRSRVV